MREFSATDLGNKTGDVLAAASQEPITIARHGKARFVMLSTDAFEKMKARGDTRRAVHVDDMSEAEAEVLVAELEANMNDE